MSGVAGNRVEELLATGLPVITVPTRARAALGAVEHVDLGAALQYAMRGTTTGIHMLVAYFSQSTVAASDRDSPDSIIFGELQEASRPAVGLASSTSSFSLAFGDLTSPESAMAMWAWYWACAWHQAVGADECADRWRESLLADLTANPDAIAQSAIGRLFTDSDFEKWFRARAPAEQDSWTDIFGLVNAADVRAAKVAIGTGAASRLFALLCARKCRVRWGGMGKGLEVNGNFHPKLYVVERGDRPDGADSVVLVGSGNWSKSALSAADHTGNVEMGMAYRVPGHVWTGDGPHGDHAAAQLARAGRQIFEQFCVAVCDWTEPMAVFTVAKRAFLVKRRPEDDTSENRPFPEGRVPYVQALHFLRQELSTRVGHSALRNLPPGMLAGIGHYQEEGARRLVAIIERDWGALLCDSTGLGKTWVAMRVIAHYARAIRDLQVVVLVPNATLSQWRAEIAQQQQLGCAVAVIPHGALQGSTVSREIRQILAADLVVVDESHNLRNGQSSRSQRLRSLLSLPAVDADGNRRPVAGVDPPRLRRTLLMTATPINNSLEDLVAQVSLFRFPEAERIQNRWPEQAEWAARPSEKLEDWLKRLRKACGKTGDWPSATAIDNYGWEWAAHGISRYLQDQEESLAPGPAGPSSRDSAAVVAKGQAVLRELLDRLMVKRTRADVLDIEKGRGGSPILFRKSSMNLQLPVRPSGEEQQVLGLLLRAFRKDADRKLTFAVYKPVGELAEQDQGNLAGLQRVLLLKRLESCSMVLLESLLRLIGLHALRICQSKSTVIVASHLELLNPIQMTPEWRTVMQLWGRQEGDGSNNGHDIEYLSDRYRESPLAKAPDTANEDEAGQIELGIDTPMEDRMDSRHLPDLINDLGILVECAGQLAPLVLGQDAADRPKWLALPTAVKWPDASSWVRRLWEDSKLAALFGLLVREFALGKKVIVFSQFADTLAYVRSVVAAAQTLGLSGDRMVEIAGKLSEICSTRVDPANLRLLLDRVGFVTGSTEDDTKETLLRAFAPYYHMELTPFPPKADPDAATAAKNKAAWAERWRKAADHPIDVLFATDVLAEGVNLQDAAVLVNFDLHWNPVRLIQRAGRIDRRLRRATEEGGESFDDLDAVAPNIPRYFFKGRAEPPVFVNAILPDELESELRLCERLARKAMTIHATVGLDSDLGLLGQLDLAGLAGTRSSPATVQEEVARTPGGAELANQALVKIDAQLDYQSRRGAPPASVDVGKFALWRAPGVAPLDPFLLVAKYSRDGHVAEVRGILRPTALAPQAELPLGPVKLTTGEVRIVDIESARSRGSYYTLRQVPAGVVPSFLQEATLADLARIAAELAPSVLKMATRDQEWCGNAAYRLIWAAIHASSSDVPEAVLSTTPGKRLNIHTFQAIQFPSGLLISES